MKASQLIKSFEKRINTEEIEYSEHKIFHFFLSGNDGGNFTVQLKNKKVKVSEGLKGEADCEIKAKAKDYVALETGDLSPKWAFVTGKVKVSDIAELLRFKNYLKEA